MYETEILQLDLVGIAQSGQCFRMTEIENGVQLIAKGKFLQVWDLGNHQFRFQCTQQEYEDIWKKYFDLNTDYTQYRECILKRDRFLQHAAVYGAGLRILNQEPFEMLVSFIISQRKSIPAIRTAVELLSKTFGSPIETEQGTFWAFPTPQQLANADLEQLKSCGLGYRAGYVLDAAQKVATGQLDLEALQNQTDENLLAQLQTVSGVGIKVASCAALFGYHRLKALPIDVWMERVIQKVYQGKWPKSYQKYAGVLQQYMFYYARCPKCDFLKEKQNTSAKTK